MNAKKLPILFLILLLSALTILTGCAIDASTLGASASMPSEPKAEATEESEDDVAEEGNQTVENNEEEQSQAEEESKLNYTVWLTNTGECYHLDTCRYLKSRKCSLTQKEAIDEGYDACKWCISRSILPEYYYTIEH